MIPSLRRRLILILSVSVVSGWMATAFFTYWDTKNEINIMLDDNLRQSARLIDALLTHMPAADWEELLTGQDEMHNNAFQIRRLGDGKILASSYASIFENGPGRGAGFRNVVRDGETWRIYGLKQNETILIEVAQRQKLRRQMAENVARHIIHPIWFAIPLLAVLIWLSVRWGLAPLQTIVHDVKSRAPDNLHPITYPKTPREILPLTQALNNLFARISRLLDKERRFTDDAAHELRTPLSVIKTHAQLIQNARNHTERQQAITDLEDGADRAIRLVNQLLVLARLDSQYQEVGQDIVCLNEIIKQTVMNETTRAIGKKIDLGVSLNEEDQIYINANSEMIMALLSNLLSNALRYTPDHGEVTVTLRRQGTQAEVLIEDSGPGIYAKDMERVFERFYRGAGNRADGSGLGLSIVARIAELYGIDIHLENRVAEKGLRAIAVFSIMSR